MLKTFKKLFYTQKNLKFFNIFFLDGFVVELIEKVAVMPVLFWSHTIARNFGQFHKKKKRVCSIHVFQTDFMLHENLKKNFVHIQEKNKNFPLIPLTAFFPPVDRQENQLELVFLDGEKKQILRGWNHHFRVIYGNKTWVSQPLCLRNFWVLSSVLLVIPWSSSRGAHLSIGDHKYLEYRKPHLIAARKATNERPTVYE